MEENCRCEVCWSEYDDVSVIPKVLHCGHSFCLECITLIIQNTCVCPKCRRRISGDANTLPTNYSVLGLIDAYKSIGTLNCELVRSIDVMKKKYLERRDILSKERLQVESTLKVIDEGLAKITELTDSESHEIDTRKAEEILTKLKEDYKTTIDYGHINYRKLINPLSLSMRNFEEPEKYLTEIYQRLQNDQKIYGVYQTGDGARYGKVSVFDDKLIFHSLTVAEVPENSSFIWFDQLKQCIGSNNFHPFIKIRCNAKNMTYMVNIKMFNKRLSNQFIKLCTGECGPSYKGSSFMRGDHKTNTFLNVLHVKSFIENGCETNRSIEYFHRNEIATKVDCKKNEMFLKLQPSGSFDIYRALVTGEVTSVTHGKVISPANLYDFIDYNNSSHLKITECGIVLYVY